MPHRQWIISYTDSCSLKDYQNIFRILFHSLSDFKRHPYFLRWEPHYLVDSLETRIILHHWIEYNSKITTWFFLFCNIIVKYWVMKKEVEDFIFVAVTFHLILYRLWIWPVPSEFCVSNGLAFIFLRFSTSFPFSASCFRCS